MFFQVFFLVLILLLISFIPVGTEVQWIHSSLWAFFLGMGIYALLLALIGIQNRLILSWDKRKKGVLLALANIYLLLFFVFYHFFLAGHRLFPPSPFLISGYSLVLYFTALFIFHATSYPFLSAGSRGAVRSPSHFAASQIRFLLPFTFPFLLFSLMLDLARLFPDNPHQEGIISLLFALGLFLMILFLPPIVQVLWQCKPLKDPLLLNMLETLCIKAHFRHGGIKTWNAMNHAYTAGILGILPPFRYVLFTQRLLDELPREAVVAILAHEIGHSYRKHLILYPFILIGMVAAFGLFSLFFSEAIDTFFILHPPSPFWNALYPLSLFLFYGLIFALYFRYVFGYYSRLFERQADLHVFELKVPAEDMQLALDQIGHVTGTHTLPCWHHHSIQSRIDFLKQAATDPSLRTQHHRKVRRSLYLYAVCLFAALILLAFFSLSDHYAIKQGIVQ